MKRMIFNRHTFSTILSIFVFAISASAQGGAFSFQGRLNDGANPANGSYDLQFTLFNSLTGGAPIAGTVQRPNATLINGVFSVNLDFGTTAFLNPNSVFIEIGVKPSGSPNAFTILGPRQQMTVVPFAVRAANATNADNATAALNAVNAVNAQNAQNANTLGGLDSSGFIRNSVAPIANQNFNIVGNGVINGTLYVAGATTIGSPTISSNLSVSGNTVQNRDKGGMVKAMLYVNQFGVIQRCYNGVTGSSTNNCGFTCSPFSTITTGQYEIDFGFRVNDRFISVTPGSGTSVNIVASFFFYNDNPNMLQVRTNITDVDHLDSYTNDDFMIIVY